MGVLESHQGISRGKTIGVLQSTITFLIQRIPRIGKNLWYKSRITLKNIKKADKKRKFSKLKIIKKTEIYIPGGSLWLFERSSMIKTCQVRHTSKSN